MILNLTKEEAAYLNFLLSIARREIVHNTTNPRKNSAMGKRLRKILSIQKKTSNWNTRDLEKDFYGMTNSIDLNHQKHHPQEFDV